MKKQMMSLMLGVSLFASTHVLAMEEKSSMNGIDEKYEEISLFSQNIPYTITVEQLRGFANQSKDIFNDSTPMESSTNICDGSRKYQFSLGNRWFALSNDHYYEKDFMDHLSKDEKITFVWKIDGPRDDIAPRFYAHVVILNKDGKWTMIDLESKDNACENWSQLRPAANNFYIIEPIEKPQSHEEKNRSKS